MVHTVVYTGEKSYKRDEDGKALPHDDMGLSAVCDCGIS